MYTLITVDKEKSPFDEIIGTFDTLEEARASRQKRDLNPYLSYIIDCNKENQDSLIKEGLRILHSINY